MSSHGPGSQAGGTNDPRAQREALLAQLDQGDAKARWEAAKELGTLADPATAPALVAALEDEDGDVRWVAAESLVALGRAGVVPLLEALASRSQSVWLRSGAHLVLQRLPRASTEDVLTPIVHALESVDAQFTVVAPATAALRTLRQG